MNKLQNFLLIFLLATQGCVHAQQVKLGGTEGVGGTSGVQTNNSRMVITTNNLPNASASVAYSQTLQENNGKTPLTWIVQLGALPPGLTLSSSSGVISGTPTAVGNFPFTILLTDSTTPTAKTATKDLSIAVTCTTLQITSQPPLPVALVGVGDNYQFLSSGGSGSITWTNPGGGIPTGTSLSSSGILSGNPTTAGSYTFNITATDSCPTPQTITVPFTQQVNSSLVITSSSPLPNGTRGSPYAGQVSASGGTSPYVWSSSGTLPPGLTLNSDGSITGTPTLAGTFTFTAIVTDNVGATNNSPFTITIDCGAALTITSGATLPNGTQGVVYTDQLLSSGGNGTVTWAQTGGTLAPGLTVLSTGVISGTPTLPGVYSPVITATDSCTPTAQTDHQTFTLTIGNQLRITTSSLPNGVQGVPYGGQVSAVGGVPPYTWSVPSGLIPTGAEDILDWLLLPLPDRNASHMSGGPNPTYSVLQGGLFWNIKNAAGNPWDIRYYDDTYTYFWFTENADSADDPTCQAAGYTKCFSDPFAYKMAVNTRPFTPRYFVPGTTTTLMTPPTLTAGNVNPGIRTTDCGADNQPLRYLGNIKTVTSGPTNVAWGGSVGTSPTLEVDYFYSGSSLGVYQDRERFYFVKGFGRVSWDHANWNGSGYTVDNTTTNNNEVAGGAPTPNFACGIPNLPQAGILPTGTILTSGPSLTLVDSTGAIVGTPNTSGTSNVTVQVEDSVGTVAQQQLSVTVTCPAISLSSTSPLPQGTINQLYSFQFQATGGATPNNWGVIGGTLPTGLSLSPSGHLSGTPLQTGNFNITVQVGDSCRPQSQSDQKNFTLAIAANTGALTITNATPLPQGTEGQSYSQQFQATGGTSPYTFTLSAGTLPAGLTLVNGLLSGTPTATSVSSFTIRVTDALAGTTTKAFTLTIICPALSNTSSSPLPPGTVGQLYSFQFNSSGGIGTKSWTATGLPAGLSLSLSGLLSGTPTVAGTSTISVTVTDSCLPSHQSVGPTGFSITISAAIPPVTISSTSPLAPGTEGVAYSNSLAVTGGVPPYTWSITSGGPLQTGLSLSAAGVISGTPTTASAITPTFHVVDSLSGADSKVLALTVSCPAFAVSSTSPLPVATQNQLYSFQFTKTGGLGTVTWTATGVPTGLTLSAGGLLSGTPTGSGTSTINVTATDSCSPTPQAIGPTGYSLTINAATVPLSITTPTPLPAGTQNQFYSITLSATGGTAPYGSWTVTVGTLPTGLSISSTTGVISGTPSATGTSSFTVRVADNTATTATKAFTLTISAPSAADQRYCNVNETTNIAGTFDGPAQQIQTCTRRSLADTPAGGPTKTVCASGCDFTTIQAASNAAVPGWIIQIKSKTGTTQNVFAGASITTSGSATNWIIYESDLIANCPAEGTRISPAWAGVASLPGRPPYNQPATPGIYMPKIRGGNNLIVLAANVHHVRFMCLEITTTNGTSVSNIISQTNNNHIVYDRIDIHGGDSPNGQDRDNIARAFSWSGCTYCAVVDSYIYDTHCVAGGTCTDSQGILLGGNAAVAEGPFTIVNNFIESASEPAFAGGGGTGATNTVPHDLEFRRNHTFHPLFWKANDPSYFGTSFTVKNLFELKNLDRVLIEALIAEQTWEGQADQHGHAILLSAKNQASAFGGTASSNGTGTITKLTGAFAFNSNQVSPNCATPLHCNFKFNGIGYKTQTVIDGTHITVAPAPPASASAAFLACQQGQNPNAQVSNVTFRYSRVSHSKNGFQIFTGTSDCGDISKGGGNISIHDVVLDDIDGATWVSAGGARSGNQSLPMGQISNDFPAPLNLHDITIRHVTGLSRLSSGNPAGGFGPGVFFTHQSQAGTSIANLKVYDSIFAAGLQIDQIGVCGGTSRFISATAVLQCVTSIGGVGPASYCFDHNVLATTTATSGASPQTVNNPPWPSASPNCGFPLTGNQLPASYDAIKFTNLNGAIGGNYQLLVASPYHNTASDGRDPGADINALNSAISGVN